MSTARVLPRVTDRQTATAYLRERDLVPSGPLPAGRIGGGDTPAIRVGVLVVQHFDPDTVVHRAATMRLLPGIAPEIVSVDEESGVLVTRYVPGANWDRQLLAGRIDARTFALAGDVVRRIHAAPVNDTTGAAQLHGNLTPADVIVSPSGALTVTGWGAARIGPAEADLARFLTRMIVNTVQQPFTEDWYVDAGRAFLSGYGAADVTALPDLVGHELLATAAAPDCARAVRTHLRSRAHAYLSGRQPLPW